MITTQAIEHRLQAIRRRLIDLRFQMAVRGPADTRNDLTKEHRDLVRERNALMEGKP